MNLMPRRESVQQMPVNSLGLLVMTSGVESVAVGAVYRRRSALPIGHLLLASVANLHVAAPPCVTSLSVLVPPWLFSSSQSSIN